MTGESRMYAGVDQALGGKGEELSASSSIVANSVRRWSFFTIIPLLAATGFFGLSLLGDIQIQRQRNTIIDGPQAATSVELWSFISTQTPASAVVVFRKPFVMSLYGGRKSHVIIPLDSLDKLDAVEQAYRENGVTHFVVDRDDINGTIENQLQGWLRAFVENNQHLKVSWQNERFTVYDWK